jgi:hypothetical protein
MVREDGLEDSVELVHLNLRLKNGWKIKGIKTEDLLGTDY